MDAERNKRKGPQPREGKAKQMEGLDLESVIERARGHDAEALGEIYRRYVRRVFGLCRYMLDSRERAEDATSEVFLKLQRFIKSYDGSIPFPRWLLRVAGNQCIDALRRQRRGRQVIVEVEDVTTVIEAASAEPSPLGAVMGKEERAQVRDAIAGLPEQISYGMLFGTDVRYLRGRRTSRGRSAAPARPPGHLPALPGTGGRI